jgi:hypothetical protein
MRVHKSADELGQEQEKHQTEERKVPYAAPAFPVLGCSAFLHRKVLGILHEITSIVWFLCALGEIGNSL